MSSFADIVSGFCPPKGSPAISPAGLFVSGSEKAVPLRVRSVNSKVHCDTGFADTTETFAFISDEDVSVVFKFPLPPRSAVYKLEATIGDRTIITEVKPKHEAQAEFDSAVNQGHTAVIAKQEESTQIFTLELGNLEAMQEGVVTISYLGVLDSVGGALEWVHTSTWRPPYLGSAGDQQRGAAAALEQNPRFASQVAYSLAYDIELLSSRGITAVESPQAVTIRDEGEGAGASKRVTLSEQVSDPSKDLTVIVELNPADSGKQAVATADGYGQVSLQRCSRPGPAGTEPRTKTVALATFVPRPLVSATADGTAAPPLNLELILIVDGSGSMHGSAIKQARESALYFIKDLPAGRGIKFNIVAFGSSHISWSPACQDFTADSMKSAVDWVQANVHANHGGTEILGTLQAVYGMPVTQGYGRQIIFLTDGGISGSEEQAVFELVSGKKAGVTNQLQSGIQRLKDRVFGRKDSGSDSKEPSLPASTLPPVLCLGIGHGVHRGLLDGMASRSGGVAQYVVDDESIVRKVGLLSRTALSGPSAVCMPRLVTASGVVRAVPHVLPPRLFPDQPLHMLVELDSSDPATSLKLQGTRADGSKWEMDMPLDKAPVVEGNAYSVLHAMCYVSGLLDGTSHLHVSADGTPLPNEPGPDDVKASVVSAAVGAHLVTRHTAAVGVMIQKDPLDPAKVTKVEVPLVVPHGADHFNAMEQHSGPQDMTLCCAMAPASVAYSMAPARAASRGGGGGSVRSMAKRMSAQPPPAPYMHGGAVPSMCAAPADMVACMTPPAPCGAPQAFSPATASAYAAPAPMSAYMAPPAPGGAPQAYPSMVDSRMDEMECSQAVDGLAQLYRRREPAQKETVDSMSTATVPAVERKLSSSDVLEMLNLCRGVEGSWSNSEALLQAVTSQVTGDRQAVVVAVRAGKPTELSEEQWATVLALAFLRKHCAGERSVWEGMEAKAMGWLSSGWPAGARAVGMVVLAAIKLV